MFLVPSSIMRGRGIGTGESNLPWVGGHRLDKSVEKLKEDRLPDVAGV